MIEKQKFEAIREKYGHWASWAVWADAGDSPKSNVGDISIFDHPDVFVTLKPDLILVGLNWSRGPVAKPLANFHDPRPMATDFKIRFALKDTPLWGAYMTDILKGYDQKSSHAVMDYLKSNKEFLLKNINLFKEELETLDCKNPIIFAFGSASFSIMKKNLPKTWQIYKVPHYANYSSKELYREQVSKIIGSVYGN